MIASGGFGYGFAAPLRSSAARAALDLRNTTTPKTSTLAQPHITNRSKTLKKHTGQFLKVP
jgi:hypothetical protein